MSELKEALEKLQNSSNNVVVDTNDDIAELKVFVVGRSTGYARWLANNVIFTEYLEDCDLVLFTGGEDVYPPLYNEPIGRDTYFNSVRDELGMPARDFLEKSIFEEAIRLGKPMFGVCRGIQFLTVMNGGKLVQDVSNHAGSSHPLLWSDGDICTTTSVHHQMCNPYELPSDEYEVLAVSQYNRSQWYMNGWNKRIKMPAEPEVLYFPKTKCLGVQGHPEMHYSYNDTIHKKLRLLIKERLLTKNEI